MALIPKDRYPAQTIAGTPGYPHGQARNVITPGDGSGTPLHADWVNDVWGFLQALLVGAGRTPSGVPDNTSNSDYLASVQTIITAQITAAIDNLANNPQFVNDPVAWGALHNFAAGLTASTIQALAVNATVGVAAPYYVANVGEYSFASPGRARTRLVPLGVPGQTLLADSWRFNNSGEWQNNVDSSYLVIPIMSVVPPVATLTGFRIGYGTLSGDPGLIAELGYFERDMDTNPGTSTWVSRANAAPVLSSSNTRLSSALFTNQIGGFGWLPEPMSASREYAFRFNRTASGGPLAQIRWIEVSYTIPNPY